MYFETIKCVDGKAKNLFYHQNRILNTVALEFPLDEYVIPPTDELLKAKVVYDKNGIVSVDFSKYQKKIITSLMVVRSDIKYDKKYLNRDGIDKLLLQKGDCDDILIVDSNGYIKDTSIANIALLIDQKWQTPSSPLLFGTTRERLLNEGAIFQNKLTISDIKRAKGIALLNAMIDFDILQQISIKGLL